MESATTVVAEIHFSAYEKLISQTAWKCFQRLNSAGVVIEYQDVMQELSVTFCLAKDKFDATKGYKFSTYLVRAMYNQFNRFAEPLIEGRNLIASVEELEEYHGGSEDDIGLYEAVSNNDPSPEELVLNHIEVKAKLRGLSNNSKRAVRELIQPSELLIEAYEAKRAQREHGMSLGVKKREVPEDMPLSFILNHQKLGKAARDNVRAEIMNNFGIRI